MKPTAHESTGDEMSIRLPSRLRLLCLGDEEPSWSGLAMRLGACGCDEPQFRWCLSSTHALTLLRETGFDCILIAREDWQAGNGGSHADVIDFLAALQAAGHNEPTVVVLPPNLDSLLVDLADSPAEFLFSDQGWQSPAIAAWIYRAIRRSDDLQQSRRLSRADDHRTRRERSETSHVIDELRRILDESPPPDDDGEPLPAQIHKFYADMLRTHVIMGVGRLSGEIRKLAEALAVAGVPPGAVLAMHLEQLESLVDGLGSRSSRHVMVRADVLGTELMLHLAECYRHKSSRTGLGDFGIDLLHAESLRQKSSHGPVAENRPPS
ncbi:hypothetical protein Mal4_23600 [Maioricimonas rarisocia]|uniref:Uncharacterized protein n=1 Tax=Maioricimonas rarisocia TaxID=2528026 RepID=A0A517Z6C1_9PLAN|nr:hypothetical protein [Maioricimonas rarisocia]QDU38040.1 hypothetical protein Mal4_23600 [Maioricimonas rarisocia]